MADPTPLQQADNAATVPLQQPDVSATSLQQTDGSAAEQAKVVPTAEERQKMGIRDLMKCGINLGIPNAELKRFNHKEGLLHFIEQHISDNIQPTSEITPKGSKQVQTIKSYKINKQCMKANFCYPRTT